jgi:hypothetical protein
MRQIRGAASFGARNGDNRSLSDQTGPSEGLQLQFVAQAVRGVRVGVTGSRNLQDRNEVFVRDQGLCELDPTFGQAKAKYEEKRQPRASGKPTGREDLAAVIGRFKGL